VKKGGDFFSRKMLDELSQFVVDHGGKGLTWIKINENGWQSSVSKFFKEEEKRAVNEKMGAAPGDLLLIMADRRGVVNQALGMLRVDVAHRMDLLPEGTFAFLWITRFPLLEYDDKEGRLQAVHHPFTSPVEEDLCLLDKQPEKARARSYDLVLNGAEIGGGSIRIHDIVLQQKMFHILGIAPQEAEAKFGFLLEALKYGAPPHGGVALGFDRLVAIMTGVKSIRETIAFPKTTSATCLLTNAPSEVSKDQLEELGLELASEQKKS
jgi:aspartyl-tRNA synthetase